MIRRLVRIVVDEAVPAGEFHIGGVRVVKLATDEELGRELRTTEVRLHGEAEAAELRALIASSFGLEEVA